MHFIFANTVLVAQTYKAFTWFSPAFTYLSSTDLNSLKIPQNVSTLRWWSTWVIFLLDSFFQEFIMVLTTFTSLHLAAFTVWFGLYLALFMTLSLLHTASKQLLLLSPADKESSPCFSAFLLFTLSPQYITYQLLVNGIFQ